MIAFLFAATAWLLVGLVIALDHTTFPTGRR